MAKTKRPWTVLEHNPIEKIEENLWAIENNVPGAKFKRRMCIIKRTDGSLLFFHAIPLNEQTLVEIKAWGKPEILIVGHNQHMMDADAFRDKLGLKLYGPKVNEDKIRARSAMTGTLEDIPKDPSMDILSLPGTKHGEAAIVLRSPNGHISLLVSDVIQNARKEDTSFMLRLFGFAGGPKVVPAFRMLFIKDKKTVKEALMRWAKIPGLHRLVPFHGRIVESGASEAIMSAAAKL